MAKARVQLRHGTYANYESHKTEVLPEEVVIIDSGHPGTTDGKAMYYRTSSGEPVRVANADELYRVATVDPAVSAEWGDEIPDTYEGRTGRAGELAFYDNRLWFLSEVVEYAQSYTHYYWLRLLDSDDLEDIESRLANLEQ